ncbi:hypothetical protein CCHL11_01299 [Colletotrichum chlorophyti]|uniref:Uncharacterized protein n=1 Tax=Colletotrichum chlorophyti TaxID=708187 RepID=A0A1Q8S7W4_9PEZI|nr:hypothetical protein CCHL11_01299 [Colletotrichum chlorophyti]
MVERDRKLITDVITDKVSRLESSWNSVPSLMHSDASSVSSAASMDNTEDTDGVQSLWVQMKERRSSLNSIKQTMAGKRKALRELRRRRDEADNSFMNMLRPILVEGLQGLSAKADGLLDRRFGEMQRLRSEYNGLESECEGLEIKIDEEEDNLNNIETRFFSLLAAGGARDVQASVHWEFSEDDRYGDQSDIPYELTGISRYGPSEDAHPLWEDLVSAIGDLSNAQEDYQDLLLLHEQYTYEMTVRRSAGRESNAEEMEFLNEFPKDENEKRMLVSRLVEEVGKLKKICEEKGAMKKHPSFKIALALDSNIGEDMSLDSSPSQPRTLAHGQFAEILSCPDHVLQVEPVTALEELKRAARLPANDPSRPSRLYVAQKEFGISRLVNESKHGDKSDFVTRWLLYNLRTSPLAVELLYSTFVHTVRRTIENRQRWQQDVLFHWWRDGAVKPPEEFSSPLTGSGMASPVPDPSLEQASMPPERDMRYATSSRAATENLSSGSFQAYPEKPSRSTTVH